MSGCHPDAVTSTRIGQCRISAKLQTIPYKHGVRSHVAAFARLVVIQSRPPCSIDQIVLLLVLLIAMLVSQTGVVFFCVRCRSLKDLCVCHCICDRVPARHASPTLLSDSLSWPDTLALRGRNKVSGKYATAPVGYSMDCSGGGGCDLVAGGIRMSYVVAMCGQNAASLMPARC